MDFADRMTAITEALEADPEEAAALAEALEEALLAAEDTDPVELGWARDYRVRALYRLGRHREGLALVTTPPPRVMALRSRNAAWLHSVAAEMAAQTGEFAEIRPLIAKALDFRTQVDEADSVRMAVETGIALLRRAERSGALEGELDRWLDEVEARAYAAEPGSPAAMAIADALSAVARAPWFAELQEGPRAEARAATMRLHAAARDGDLEALRGGLAAGVDPSARHLGWSGIPTPLIAASFAGHAEVVDALIAGGAALDACNIQGRTALHLAADQDHAGVVAALLAAGAEPDLQDFHGHSALHLAAWQDHRGALDALLEGGVAIDLELRDINGDTALGVAATEPVPAVVRRLLEAGAEVDAVNNYGHTPLLRAAMEGQGEVVGVLLGAGADPRHRDHAGRSARDWAEAEGHSEVVRGHRGLR
jgi:hypothetical protein